MNTTAPSPADPRLLQLSADDNIAAAKTPIEAGETILIAGAATRIRVRIPTGHKLAILPIAAGQKVMKYGAPIGSATRDIGPGEHVHTHNLKSDYLPTYTLDGSSPYLQKE